MAIYKLKSVRKDFYNEEDVRRMERVGFLFNEIDLPQIDQWWPGSKLYNPSRKGWSLVKRTIEIDITSMAHFEEISRGIGRDLIFDQDRNKILIYNDYIE